MLDKLIDLDKQVFVFLNGLGSDNFDSLWLSITKQVYWTPFFLFIFYLLQKKIGWKNFVFYLIFMTVLILLCDQTTNIFKEYFQRLRPCNNEEIKSIIRIVKTSDTYSFFSGHAANSMASTFFSFMILKKYYNHVYVLFLFPLIFAYSRIYLGLHFPSDILIGYLVGAIFGYLCFKIFLKYTFKN